jgi:hypothetical protein
MVENDIFIWFAIREIMGLILDTWLSIKMMICMYIYIYVNTHVNTHVYTMSAPDC